MGSLADVSTAPNNIRFTPANRHRDHEHEIRKVPTTDIVAFVNSIVLFFKVQIFGDPAAAEPLWNSYILKASFILFLNVVCPSCCCEQLIERDLEACLAADPFQMAA
jgi:hypothetical protein